MIAKQIMTTRVHTASPNDLVDKLIHKMAKEGISGLPVVDKNKKLLGIITETDIAEHESNPHTPRAISLLGGLIYLDDLNNYNETLKKICAQKAKDLMSENLVAVEENATLEEIIKIMNSNNLSRIPVTDKKGHLKGIITRTDIIRKL